jgi:hypothetical protein
MQVIPIQEILIKGILWYLCTESQHKLQKPTVTTPHHSREHQSRHKKLCDSHYSQSQVSGANCGLNELKI